MHSDVGRGSTTINNRGQAINRIMLIVEVAGHFFLCRPKCDESRLNVDQPLMTTLIDWSRNELNDADASAVTPENFENL